MFADRDRAYVIAEVGSNHGGDLEAALRMISLAAAAGADAVKFQMFRVDRFLRPRAEPQSIKRYEMPNEWLPALRSWCESSAIDFLCTAFDIASLRVVDPFVRAHKIGSWEAPLTDYVDAVARCGKPILISNGVTGHVDLAIGELEVITLNCVSKYPAAIDDYHLRRWSGTKWGVSDHTLDPLTVPSAAIALGARVVEKHMREAANAGEHPDFGHSIDERDFARMVQAIRRTEAACA